jgi:hypothetical protein
MEKLWLREPVFKVDATNAALLEPSILSLTHTHQQSMG